MRLIEALSTNPGISIFAVLDSDLDDKGEWDVEPLDGQVLCQSEIDYYFVVKGKKVLTDGTVRDCYIDINLPERISDYAFFVVDGRLDARYHHELDGEIICAVPIACFGAYELFCSKIAPEVGIEVLNRGLAQIPLNPFIALDLGYILRDEHRFKEAAEMFKIAVDEGDSSYHWICGELAGCYDELGETDKAHIYREMFNHPLMTKKRGICASLYDWWTGKKET